MDYHHVLAPKHHDIQNPKKKWTYCWWKKPCTSWYFSLSNYLQGLYVQGGDRRISSINNIIATPVDMSHEKNPLTFHYTGCLIGILIMVYYNPHITGYYNPLRIYPKQLVAFFIAHMAFVESSPTPDTKTLENVERRSRSTQLPGILGRRWDWSSKEYTLQVIQAVTQLDPSVGGHFTFMKGSLEN